MSGEVLARQAVMTAPTATSVAPTGHADAAALTQALVERAAQDARQARASIDALTTLLGHTLDKAVPGKKGPAQAIARTVAESFVSGETLEMALLRATATADTLSLGEPETRQVQRAITESLTSTDVLAPLVSPVTDGSALSEAALCPDMPAVAGFSTSEAPRADIPGGAAAVSPAKREAVIAELLQEAPHQRPAGISVVCDELRLELSSDGHRKLPYRQTVAGAWAGTRPKRVIAWAAFAVFTPLAIWSAHARMASDTSPAPNLPLLSLPPAAAPLATPRPNAPAADRAKAAPSESSLAPAAKNAQPSEHPKEVRGSAVQAASASPRTLVPLPTSPEPKVSARGSDHVEAARLLSARSENVPATEPLGLPAVTGIVRRETRGAGEDPTAIIDWLLGEGAHRER